MGKIFVGTLECGEGDFKYCVEAIASQINVEVTHCIISNLPEKDAHNKLWASWREAQNSHDLFVKVDADTVLRSPDTLSTILDLFKSNSRVTGVQAYLHDYLSDSLIYGLNSFSPKVTFKDTVSDLYCDRNIEVGHDVSLRADDLIEALKPAGYHCKFSHIKQAFHYGMHRALKNQHLVYKNVCMALEREYSDTRFFAKLGFEVSNVLFKGKTKMNYNDEKFNDVFEKTLRTVEKNKKS